MIEACNFGCSNRTCITCIDTDGDGYNATGGLCGVIDCNDNSNLVYPGAAEICDNIDNDCDIAVDEDFTNLNQVCSVGIGECESDGIFVCSSNGSATQCNAVPNQPSNEICDGLDNNCNTQTDETGNALCNDNLYCNGEETCAGTDGCLAGSPINIDDDISCTDDSCDETNDIIINTANNSNCDDNLYCNGVETCNAQLDCQSGTSVDPDDGILCTEDFCNELTDSIINIPEDNNCPSDTICADNYCDVSLDCQVNYEPSTTECRPSVGQCDAADFCTGFNSDCPNQLSPNGTTCSDNFFCTINDVCVSGVCGSVTQRDCSSNNILINECEYSPDDIDYTLDYYSFTSVCNEITDQCADRPLVWELLITHTCNINQCGAECIEDNNCQNTECDGFDSCIGNDYYDYQDVQNNCLSDCACETNICNNPTIIQDDSRCITCGNSFLDNNEECELPNTNNNNYCSQTTETCDSTNHTAVRDDYGNCNSVCGCVEDSFSAYSCITNSCGAECEVNADCNDNNSSTEDICNTNNCSCEYTTNPFCGDGNLDAGEECDDGNNINGDSCSSNCELEIECSSDSECSADYYSDQYCSGNNLSQDFYDYSCINSGTINSQCVLSISALLVEKCDYGCNSETNCCNGCNPDDKEICNGIDDDCDGQIDEIETFALDLTKTNKDSKSITGLGIGECKESCPSYCSVHTPYNYGTNAVWEPGLAFSAPFEGDAICSLTLKSTGFSSAKGDDNEIVTAKINNVLFDSTADICNSGSCPCVISSKTSSRTVPIKLAGNLITAKRPGDSVSIKGAVLTCEYDVCSNE